MLKILFILFALALLGVTTIQENPGVLQSDPHSAPMADSAAVFLLGFAGTVVLRRKKIRNPLLAVVAG